MAWLSQSVTKSGPMFQNILFYRTLLLVLLTLELARKLGHDMLQHSQKLETLQYFPSSNAVGCQHVPACRVMGRSSQLYFTNINLLCLFCWQFSHSKEQNLSFPTSAGSHRAESRSAEDTVRAWKCLGFQTDQTQIPLSHCVLELLNWATTGASYGQRQPSNRRGMCPCSEWAVSDVPEFLYGRES